MKKFTIYSKSQDLDSCIRRNDGKKHIKCLQKIIVILSFSFPLFASANPAFSVGPDRTYVNLNEPQTYVFIIKNTGDQLIHLRVTPVFLPVQSTALAAGKSLVSDKEQAANSLVPYTIISPQVLSLQPNQQRDVRVSIRVPGNLKPGTYREHLNVKMLEVARQINSEATGSNNVGIHLNLLMQIAPVIYGDVGTNQASLAMSCQLDKNNILTLNAINKTPWHFNGSITGYGTDETKPLFTVNGIVFRESSTSILTKWKADVSTVNLVWRNDHNPDADVQKTTCNLK